jgi:hypothetical protein
MISPEELLITAAVTAKLSRIATSKFPSKQLEKGGCQREDKATNCHAK